MFPAKFSNRYSTVFQLHSDALGVLAIWFPHFCSRRHTTLLSVLTSYAFMYTLVRPKKKSRIICHYCFLKFIFQKVQVVFRNLLPYGSIIEYIYNIDSSSQNSIHPTTTS